MRPKPGVIAIHLYIYKPCLLIGFRKSVSFATVQTYGTAKSMGTFVVVKLRMKLIRRRLLDVGTMQEKDQYKSNSIPGRRSEH